MGLISLQNDNILKAFTINASSQNSMSMTSTTLQKKRITLTATQSLCLSPLYCSLLFTNGNFPLRSMCFSLEAMLI